MSPNKYMGNEQLNKLTLELKRTFDLKNQVLRNIYERIGIIKGKF